MSAWLVNRLLYGGIGLMPKNRWKIALDAGFLIIWRDQIFGFDVGFMLWAGRLWWFRSGPPRRPAWGE